MTQVTTGGKRGISAPGELWGWQSSRRIVIRGCQAQDLLGWPGTVLGPGTQENPQDRKDINCFQHAQG